MMTLGQQILSFAASQRFEPDSTLLKIHKMKRKVREAPRFTSRDLIPSDAKALRVSLPAIEFHLEEPREYLIVWVHSSRDGQQPRRRTLRFKCMTPQ